MEDKINKVIDFLTPLDGLAYVYPLLIINLINEISRLVYEPLFYQSSRFDFILALMFLVAIIDGAFRSLQSRRNQRLGD